MPKKSLSSFHVFLFSCFDASVSYIISSSDGAFRYFLPSLLPIVNNSVPSPVPNERIYWGEASSINFSRGVLVFELLIIDTWPGSSLQALSICSSNSCCGGVGFVLVLVGWILRLMVPKQSGPNSGASND